MEIVDNKLIEIKELADNFITLQYELGEKIQSYIIDILHEFNDEFIEFDSEQRETTKYLFEGRIMTLIAIQLEHTHQDSPYVSLTFENGYGVSDCILCEMTIEQQISIIDDVTNYIKKYGYKNTNDID